MKQLIADFEALRARFPAGFESSLVLPCLRRIQDVNGFISYVDIAGLVDYLGVPRNQIEEVLSFYGQFRREPVGRWHIQVCRNISCSLLGAERVLQQMTQKLGIEPGQTTEDGRFTLSTVECLASCGTAPVVMINEAYHENIDPQRVDALLESLR